VSNRPLTLSDETFGRTAGAYYASLMQWLFKEENLGVNGEVENTQIIKNRYYLPHITCLGICQRWDGSMFNGVNIIANFILFQM
jgi:hypothetical protein